VSRIRGVPDADAGPFMKVLYALLRKGMGRMAGRMPERGLEPIEMYALRPRLLMAYGRLEQATAKLHGIDRRTHALATLKAATMTNCEYCIDIGSAISRSGA